MSDLIKVCLFGQAAQALRDSILSADLGETHARGFEFQERPGDGDLAALLVSFRPHAIVTIGRAEDFRNLWNSPLEVRQRWLNYDPLAADGRKIGEDVMRTFVRNATEGGRPGEPLVSVFTPTYLTGDRIQRPLKSMLRQTYRNWEWVIFDDSPDDGATFGQMCQLARADSRVQAFRGAGPIGIIGEVKRRACGLARGSILVELDHDDELTDDCLELLVAAFAKFPDAGFAYTDCCEVAEDGTSLTYKGGTYAFGFGSYRTDHYRGRAYQVTNYPGINAKTIRHIVGVPNHVRAWRKDAYAAIGGHSPEVHVCDDYELLVRTFLKTRMVHIRQLGYLQYHGPTGGGNTQRRRNKEIQRLVAYFRARYEDQIHHRLLELGVDDWIRTDKGLDWSRAGPAREAGRDANYVWEPRGAPQPLPV
jgi:hypothetical protein